MLSDGGFQKLKTSFEWRPVPRNTVPSDLLKVVPEGNILASDRFNETFNSNPTYAHGFVVVIEGGNWECIYFLANDIDHPMKKRGQDSIDLDGRWR